MGRAVPRSAVSHGGNGAIANLHDLFRDQLRDIHSVECQLIPALAELESLGACEPLRRRFRRQVEETRGQKERLEAIGRARGWDLGGDPSKAMEGLISGGRAHVAKVDFQPARDFLIIAHTHRIKHYEIAAYAVTVTLADRIGLRQDAELLRASMEEERAMDESLTRLADQELLGEIPAE